MQKCNKLIHIINCISNSTTQVSHGYYLAISPVDGHIYISDPEKYRVIRLLAVSNVTDAVNNLEVVAGNGERCIPGKLVCNTFYLRIN